MSSASLRLQPVFFDFIVNEYRSLKQNETGVCAFSFLQSNESSTWTVSHNRDFTVFKASVFTLDGDMIIPDDIIIVDSSLFLITFNEPVAGSVNVLYKSKAAIDCIPTVIVQDSIVAGINSNGINADTINGWNDVIPL